MIVMDNVPIADLVKKIFRETYGVEDDELYRNDELRESIRNAVKILRDSYKDSVCLTPYNDEDVRKAYMIAYYPYYIAPAQYVMKEHAMRALLKTVITEYEDTEVDDDGNEYTFMHQIDIRTGYPFIEAGYSTKLGFFASGPCPELYGVISALKDARFCDKIEVTTFDSEPNWLPYQEMTAKLCKGIMPFKSTWHFYNHNIGDLSAFEGTFDFVKELHATEVFFMQNYLSHMPDTPEALENFLCWFSVVAKWAQFNATFVFIDLNYPPSKTALSKLVDENFLAENGLKKIAAHIHEDGEPLTIRHDNTTKALLDNIFTGGYGLIQKKNTKFYFVVLQKTAFTKSVRRLNVTQSMDCKKLFGMEEIP